MCRRIVAIGAIAAVAGCGGDTRTIRLVRAVPDVDPACGAPGDAVTMRITAVGDFASLDVGEVVDVASGEVSLDRFPPATRALEVVVLGPGGQERVIGRTATFAIDELDSGDEVPVFMAPRRGFCPTGPPAVAREQLLLARAGDKVLIAGGIDGGQPVTEVELYDPATATFESLGPILSGGDGLAGASATTLADGRVLIAGGPNERYVVFDPETGTAGAGLFFDGGTAYHAAVLLPDGRVLFAGGCASGDVRDQRCDGPALPTVSVLDVDDPDGVVRLEGIAIEPRIGGTAIADGDGRVTLIGGVDDSGAAVTFAERIDLTGVRPPERIPDLGMFPSAPGVGSAVAALEAGGFVSAFASPLATIPGAVASVVAPDATGTTAIAGSPIARAGASITSLEDGRALVLGGTVDMMPAAEAMLYLPADGRFDDLDAAPTDRRKGHAAIRLDDGSVLVVGGTPVAGGDAVADAWVFRPDLTGPFTPNLDITFEDDRAQSLVPRDPGQIAVEPPVGSEPAHYVITSSGSSGLPSEWAVVAGPRLAQPKLSLTAGTDSVADNAGVAVVIAFVSADDYHFIVLRPGQVAELLHLVAGQPVVTGCAGVVVAAGQLQSEPRRHRFEVAVTGRNLTASIDGDQVLDCLDLELPVGGAGVGVVGPPGDSVVVDRIAVSR